MNGRSSRGACRWQSVVRWWCWVGSGCRGVNDGGSGVCSIVLGPEGCNETLQDAACAGMAWVAHGSDVCLQLDVGRVGQV